MRETSAIFWNHDLDILRWKIHFLIYVQYEFLLESCCLLVYDFDEFCICFFGNYLQYSIVKQCIFMNTLCWSLHLFLW